MRKALIFLAIILSLIFLLRFNIGGPEDNWICDKGEWISHGKPSYAKPENPCGQKINLPNNKEGCLKINGVWKKQGPEPFETCNVKAKDRGNVCHDNRECQGMCQVNLSKEEMNQGMKGNIDFAKKHGQCSVWVVELGCFGMMEQGKTQVICID